MRPAGRAVTVIVTPPGHAEVPDGSGQFESREHGMSQSRVRRRLGTRRLLHPEPDGAERGSLTLMLAVLFVTLVALAGIVVDGGTKLAAAENATAAAQEAARAGAGIVNRATAYSNGSFVVNRGEAIAAAEQYLATVPDLTSDAVSVNGNSLRVTVRLEEPTKVLSIINIDSMTETGEATATLVSGVTGPGR
jgi:Flp pilus assembly protein TadG